MDRFEKKYNEFYEQVASELRTGQKKSHWIWFIFPQIAGLGSSYNSTFYAIRSVYEAKMFLKSSCGKKMQELLKILLESEICDPEIIFGDIDAMKLKSSMTLFAESDPENPIFRQVLDKFYNGENDKKTLENMKTLCNYTDPDDFLKKFIPAYDNGNIEILHELRLNIFEETIQIVNNGGYSTIDGDVMSLPDPAKMMENSEMYQSVKTVKLPELQQKTIVEVLDSDSLLAGKNFLMKDIVLQF